MQAITIMKFVLYKERWLDGRVFAPCWTASAHGRKFRISGLACRAEIMRSVIGRFVTVSGELTAEGSQSEVWQALEDFLVPGG